MALFEIELLPLEEVEPWPGADGPSLSWFALTDGAFRMNVGDQVLFEYTEEILKHWQTHVRPAEYQVAAFVRELLGSVPAGMAPLSERVERLARDWTRLTELREASAYEEDGDLGYAAWLWLSERTPFAPYLLASPSLHLLRIGDEVRVHWDNRERRVDGIRVWTADCGVFALPAPELARECHGLAERLLSEMSERIASLETGTRAARIPLDAQSLRRQHESWRAELEACFGQYEPGIPWDETEHALSVLAARHDLDF